MLPPVQPTLLWPAEYGQPPKRIECPVLLLVVPAADILWTATRRRMEENEERECTT